MLENPIKTTDYKPPHPVFRDENPTRFLGPP